MTDPDTTDVGESFAEFEANLGKPEVEDEAPKPEEQVDDPDAADEEAADEEGEEKAKRRSKPASQRIADITREKHEALRRAQAAEERLAALEGSKTEAKPTELAEPNPDEFEFGEADPAYLKALARYEVKAELAEEAKRADETRQADAQRQQAADLDRSWAEKATKGAEKYADFNEVVNEGAAAGDWACPPMMAVAISVSDVGADVAYHLASNPAESRALAAQSQVNPMAAAEEFGKIEGRFLETEPQMPTGPNINQLDIARYAGQMRGFMSKEPTVPAKRMTDAPEPPKHSVRGGGGRFDVGDDTDDFAAFERKHMGKR